MPAQRRTRGDARLLIACPDRPGIVAAVASFLYGLGANVVDSSQHSTDPEGGTFFMRMAFRVGDDVDRDAVEAAFAGDVAERFEMRWRLAWADRSTRTAILVGTADHAALELLWRWRNGELPADVRLMASNHDRLRPVAESFGLPFHHLPVAPGREAEQEARLRELLEGEGIELVVLARYMRILGPAFVRTWPGRIINIHHSFLPAFVGANPYRRAHERGVKLVGATAHYVTDDLDEGPIIAQDVVRVSHRESVRDLVRLGKQVERAVLARAVEAHLEDAILVHENKTIVFET